MPSAVIKMEGGTDHDLRILDLTSEEEEEKSAIAGGEPSKRETPKSADGDRKPLIEKDKNEKVGFVFVSSHQPQRFERLLIKTCVTGRGHPGSHTKRSRKGRRWDESGGTEGRHQRRNVRTEESKFILQSRIISDKTWLAKIIWVVYQPRRKRKRSGDSDDEGSGSESDSDSDSDSNSYCSDKSAKNKDLEDKDDDEEEGEGWAFNWWRPSLLIHIFQPLWG